MATKPLRAVRVGVAVILTLAFLVSIWAGIVGNNIVFAAAILIDVIAGAFLYRELRSGTHPQAMPRDTHFDR
ncbi:MAG: hypothetical protein ACREXY_29430 [Gammaproteobacteria bacterium]